MRKSVNLYIIPIIFVLALVLRLLGLTHGFPFIFHPDEPTIVRSALGLRFFINPGHFDWPHLVIYLNYFAYMLFAYVRDILSAVNLKDAISVYVPLIWNDELVFYFIGRLLTAIFGAATVIPVYLAGRDTFGHKAGIFAALFFALIPFHVWHSHYSLADVPMVFFLAWSLYFILNILKKRELGDYTGAGFYSGLAASAKYNGGLIALFIPIAHAVRMIKNKEKITDLQGYLKLLASVVTALIGFLIGTPFAALDYATFSRTDGPKGAFWQFTNVGSVPISSRIPEFVSEMVYKIADDVGYIGLLLFFGMILILVKRFLRKENQPENTILWFLIFAGTLLLFYISGFSRSRSHYFMIAYPFIVLVFGYVADKVISHFFIKNGVFAFMFFITLYSVPVYMSAKNAYIFYKSDTRVAALNWLSENTATTDYIYYNKNSLVPVIQKLGRTNTVGEPSKTTIKQGYLFLAYDETCGCLDFPLVAYGSRANLVAFADNTNRLGPKLAIYKVVP